MTNSIPASTIVDVIPGVLQPGGSALEIIGLFLTTSTSVPVGSVSPFASASDVQDYFGPNSVEAAYAAVYFAGYDNSLVKPMSLLYSQYNQVSVAAYLRGASIAAMPLATLQSISGTLALTMDGYARSGSVVLSSATSFSSAAASIQTAMNSALATEASFTGAFGAAFTGTSTGTSLAVTSVTGYLSPGDVVAGTGITTGTTVVSQSSGPAGGAGTYIMSVSGTASTASLTSTSGIFVVSAVASGTLAVGQTLAGASVPTGTIITALGTGATGTTGNYVTNLVTASFVKINSESMTTTPTPVTVSYDSVSGGMIILSGITGAPSLAGFATAGTVANALLLTQTTGAVISQGAVAASPIPYMTSLANITQNWVTFTHTFDPDGGSGNTQKLLFAEWTSQQDDAYAYIVCDTDASATNTVPATMSLGYLINQSDYSGTCVIYQPSEFYLGAFVCGAAASVDYSQTQGKVSFKFRTQAGITPSVKSATVAANLTANGYNYYGGYATRTNKFNFFANGAVSGPFVWLDAYINQIWLNSNLQAAILSGLMNNTSVPYNNAGYTKIKEFCSTPINDALNFGAIQPGVTLSGTQIADINSQANIDIATTVSTRGWYLQVLPASPAVRAARQSPACTLWYTDGGAVQQINLASIDVE